MLIASYPSSCTTSRIGQTVMYIAPLATQQLLLTIRSRTSCRPKTMTTSIGSKRAAEPHERVLKESQLQREAI